MTAFEEFGVVHELGMAVEEMEWSLPTDIQAEAIPAILGGGDVLMAAETGSGKTGAFCLPVLQIVWESVRDLQMGKHPKSMDQQSQQTAVGSKWAMNMHDRDSLLAIDGEGTTCQSREHQAWQGCRANRGVVNGGKYYFEAVVTDEGLCRVGWSSGQASHDLGTDKLGYGYGGTGKKSWNKNFDNYGEAYGMSDIIGCMLDLDNGAVTFSKNGKDFGVAWSLDPSLRHEAFYPAVVLKNAEMKFNFGDQPFKFQPSGFIGCAQVAGNHVIVSKVVATAEPVAPQKPRPNAPMAIIIEPTRELAEQCYKELQRFKKHLKDPVIRELCILGGGNAREQTDALHQGVDIVVGTPGRLMDLVSSKDLLLNNIRFFILDEADGLISQGHANVINEFYGQIPQRTSDGKRLQMIVCSATLHNFDVKKMADKLMHFPQWIDLKGQDSVPDTVHHVAVLVDPKNDQSWRNMKRSIATDGVHGNNISLQGNSQDALSQGVKMLKGDYVLAAIRKFNMDQCLIFCRTKIDCDNLEQYLRNVDRNLSCVCLHGDRKPQERQANLESFKQGRARFMICTDVAARGLDIRGLPYVINVTLPDEAPNYIHRIGRVGRADRMGLAISLISTVPEKVWYHTCPSRGQSCHNTNLREDGGCCIWYNETGLMGDIEEHLGVTVPIVGKEMEVPVDEFEGKVTYGQKRKAIGTGYQDHVSLLQATIGELADLEKRAQTSFLNMRYLGNKPLAAVHANGSA